MRAWCGGKETDRERDGKKEKLGRFRQEHTGQYLGGDFVGGQELLLDALVLLKHFITLVLGYAQPLFQLN